MHTLYIYICIYINTPPTKLTQTHTSHTITPYTYVYKYIHINTHKYLTHTAYVPHICMGTYTYIHKHTHTYTHKNQTVSKFTHTHMYYTHTHMFIDTCMSQSNQVLTQVASWQKTEVVGNKLCFDMPSIKLLSQCSLCPKLNTTLAKWVIIPSGSINIVYLLWSH